MAMSARSPARGLLSAPSVRSSWRGVPVSGSIEMTRLAAEPAAQVAAGLARSCALGRAAATVRPGAGRLVAVARARVEIRLGGRDAGRRRPRDRAGGRRQHDQRAYDKRDSVTVPHPHQCPPQAKRSAPASAAGQSSRVENPARHRVVVERRLRCQLRLRIREAEAGGGVRVGAGGRPRRGRSGTASWARSGSSCPSGCASTVSAMLPVICSAYAGVGSSSCKRQRVDQPRHHVEVLGAGEACSRSSWSRSSVRSTAPLVTVNTR